MTDRGARVVRLHESVRARLGPDRGFLFDERTGRVYSLSSTAAFVAARLARTVPFDAIAAEVSGAFAVDTPTARRDLERFVAQLVTEGLATTAGSGAGG